MEERLEMLQRQQPFPTCDIAPDSDFLDAAHSRLEGSDHSTPNVTPRASNHSNLSSSEPGNAITEQDEGKTRF